MPNTLKIDIGPNGFKGNDKKPKFKVKKNQLVEFNLVDGAQPRNVYFSARSPFSINPVPVGSAGSGELSLLSTVQEGDSFAMEVQDPAADGGTDLLRDGMNGEIDVDRG